MPSKASRDPDNRSQKRSTRSISTCQVWEHMWHASSKCSMRIADVMIFYDTGVPNAWFFTAKSGEIKKKSRDSLRLEKFYKRLVNFSNAETLTGGASNMSGGGSTSGQELNFVAVVYLADGAREAINARTLRELTFDGHNARSSVPKWKGIMPITAIRAYVPPKGGHGSGFRNCYKYDSMRSGAVTSTQRLLALGEHVAGNRRLAYSDQRSTMRKLNSHLDGLTENIVRFARATRGLKILLMEADYVIDSTDRVWFVHSLEAIVVRPNKRAKRAKELTVPVGPTLSSSSARIKTSTMKEMGATEHSDMSGSGKAGAATTSSLPSSSSSSPPPPSSTHVSASALRTSPAKGQHSALDCAGNFCAFDAEAQRARRAKNGARKRQRWTTDKAIEREREALQETIKQYRRTMSSTAALSKGSKLPDHVGAVENSPGAGASSDAPRDGTNQSSYRMLLRSVLQPFERGAGQYMSQELSTWCDQQEKEKKQRSSSILISFTEPQIGDTISLTEPLFIRWQVSTRSGVSRPSHVDLHLYCGFALAETICLKLPNEGYAAWRAPVTFRRREADTLRDLQRAAVWRVKVTCSSDPNLWAFSPRFRLQRGKQREGAKHTAAGPTRRHELELQLEEEERSLVEEGLSTEEGLSCFRTRGPGVLANAHPASFYFRECLVCENCFHTYSAMDKKRERTARKGQRRGAKGVWQQRLERQRNRLKATDADTGMGPSKFTGTQTSPSRRMPLVPAVVREDPGSKPRGLARHNPGSLSATRQRGRARSQEKQDDEDVHTRNDIDNDGPAAANQPGPDSPSDHESARTPRSDVSGEDEPLVAPNLHSDNNEQPVVAGSSPQTEFFVGQGKVGGEKIISNFVSRVVLFIHENFAGRAPGRFLLHKQDLDLVQDVNTSLQNYLAHLEQGVDVDQGILDVVNVANIGSAYLMSTAYWQLLDHQPERCATITGIALDLVLLISMITAPYDQEFARAIQEQLNVKKGSNWVPREFTAKGLIPSGHALNPPKKLRPLAVKSGKKKTKKSERSPPKRSRGKKQRAQKKLNHQKRRRARERGWGKGPGKKRGVGEDMQIPEPISSPVAGARSDDLAYRPTFPAWNVKRAAHDRRTLRKPAPSPHAAAVEQQIPMASRKLPDANHYIKASSTAPSLESMLPLPPRLAEDASGLEQTSGQNDNTAFHFGRSSLRRALWLGRNALEKAAENDEARHRGQHSLTTAASRSGFKYEVRQQEMLQKHGGGGGVQSRSTPALLKSLGTTLRRPEVGKSVMVRTRKVHSKTNNKPRRKKKKRSSQRAAGRASSDTRSSQMPPELDNRMGLRQVLTLLVLGQLTDVRTLIKIADDNGLRVLAHSRAEGEKLVLGAAPRAGGNRSVPQTPPFAAKLLRDYLQVARCFSNIFHGLIPNSSAVVGAGEFGSGVRVNSDEKQDSMGSKSRMKRTYRAVEAVEQLVAWMGVGQSRGEILKGVAVWLGGQGALAHHHWNKAIEAAAHQAGPLAYDAAVAKFLIGKHRASINSPNVRDMSIAQLMRADAHFAKLGPGASTEHAAVRAELTHLQGTRPVAPQPGRDILGQPPALPKAGNTETSSNMLHRPPTAIQETLNWGKRSLEAVKRRLHHERMLPVYHPDEDATLGMTIEQLSSKRESLAKAVVVAEGQLAALEAEIQSAVATGCNAARPDSAMGFTMERKLVKLIDGISIHANELSVVAEKELRHRAQDRHRAKARDVSGHSAVVTTGVPSSTESPAAQARPPKQKATPPAKINTAGLAGAQLLMVLKTQLFEGARDGLLDKVTQVTDTGMLDILTTRDQEGGTALIVATQNKRTNVIEFLAARGRENYVNQQNLEGNTALHYAYESGDEKIVQLLLQYGANAKIVNMYGLPPARGAAPHKFSDFAL